MEGDPGREPRAVQLLSGFFGSEEDAKAAAAERIRPKGLAAESPAEEAPAPKGRERKK